MLLVLVRLVTDLIEKKQIVMTKRACEGCIIHSTTLSTLRLARKLISKYDFQLFDSLVVASALEANCKILYSEDFQHNQLIMRMTG